MGLLYVALVVVCGALIIESLPVDRPEINNIRKNNRFNELFNEFVSGTVQRNKRGGIINVHLCPVGFGKLYGTKDCVSCYGRTLPGCPEIPDDPDYNDV